MLHAETVISLFDLVKAVFVFGPFSHADFFLWLLSLTRNSLTASLGRCAVSLLS
jgi:hypothetical protein